MGLLRLRQGHHAQAIALFQAASRVKSDDQDKWKSLAVTARFWGLLREAADARSGAEYGLALDKLGEARGLNPKEPAAAVAQARIHNDQGRTEAAEAAYREALKLDGSDANALTELLTLYVRSGRGDLAKNEMAALNPTQRNALLTELNVIEAGMLRREADALIASGRTAEAMERLLRAIQKDANDPWLRFDLARLYVAQGDRNAGEALFSDLLARNPGGAAALYAKALFQSSGDDELGALRTLENIAVAERDRKVTVLQRELWTQLQTQHARRLAAADGGKAGSGGSGGEAARSALLLAEKATAGDAELAMTVAQAWASIGEPLRGKRLAESVQQKQGAQASSWQIRYARILFQANADAELELWVDSILQQGKLTPEQSADVDQLRIDATLRAADVAVRAGHPDDAQRLLLAALEKFSNRPALRVALGKIQLNGRDSEAAENSFRAALALEPQNAAALDGVLAALVERNDVPRLLMEIDTRLAKMERAAPITSGSGDGDGDSLRMDEALAAREAQRSLLIRRADLLRKTGELGEAEAVLRRIVAMSPGDSQAWEKLARVLVEAKRNPAAVMVIESALLAMRGDDDGNETVQLGMIDLLIDLKAYAQAKLALQQRTASREPRLFALHARMARLEGRMRDLLVSLQQEAAMEDAPAEGTRSVSGLSQLRLGEPVAGRVPLVIIEGDANPKALTEGGRREIAELLDDRAAWVSAAVDVRDRKGTSGISSIALTEIPVELRVPRGNNEAWIFRSDVVHIGAGQFHLDDLYATKRYGNFALCLVNGNCPAVKEQVASGTAWNVAYVRDTWKVDVGQTPNSFPVRNWVGGILQKGDLGPLSYSADLSRRSITSTLLSYAGVTTETGIRWGGVVATGLRFGLSADNGGALGVWSSYGQHLLTGENVKTNHRSQFMVGGYWRAINDPDRLLSIGLTGMDWRFSQNAGEFSYGHGGYYSPAQYNSLSLPVQFSQRFERFSYAVRAAASTSRSRTDQADFYPTDSALQAQVLADSVANRTNSVNPVYAASTGPSKGRGRSFHASGEYQLGSSLFIGGRIEVERAADYSPNRGLFYVRYNLDRPAAQPVRMPPEPMNPTSQY